MKIVDYAIVFDTSTSGLAEKVRTEMTENWQPIGGVTMASYKFPIIDEEPTLCFAQAMAKYE